MVEQPLIDNRHEGKPAVVEPCREARSLDGVRHDGRGTNLAYNPT